MRAFRILILSAALAAATAAGGVTITAGQTADPRGWIAASNKHAQVLLDVLARVSPEGAGQFGVSGLDEAVTNLTAAEGERARAATEAALKTLERAVRPSKTRSCVRTSTSSSARRRPTCGAGA